MVINGENLVLVWIYTMNNINISIDYIFLDDHCINS